MHIYVVNDEEWMNEFSKLFQNLFVFRLYDSKACHCTWLLYWNNQFNILSNITLLSGEADDIDDVDDFDSPNGSNSQQNNKHTGTYMTHLDGPKENDIGKLHVYCIKYVKERVTGSKVFE